MNFNNILIIVYVFIIDTNAHIYSIIEMEVSDNLIDNIIENMSVLKCHLSCDISSTCKEIAFEETLTPSIIRCYHMKVFSSKPDEETHVKMLKVMQKLGKTTNTKVATATEETTTTNEETTPVEEAATTEGTTTAQITTTYKAVTQEIYKNCKEGIYKNFVKEAEGWFYVDPDEQGSMIVKCINETKAGNFTGSYEFVNPTNNWHYINITKTSIGTYQAKNRANIKWKLYSYDWNELRNDENHPYSHRPDYTYTPFTNAGLLGPWSLLYKKVSDLNHGNAPDVIVNHAKTLILKRGVVLEIDSLNDGSSEDNNYWIGIHNFTRLTFMKPQNLIINFVRSSGFTDYTMYRNFHTTNIITSSVSFSRILHKEKGTQSNFLTNETSWSLCKNDFKYWWYCTENGHFTMNSSLAVMQKLEIYISEIL